MLSTHSQKGLQQTTSCSTSAHTNVVLVPFLFWYVFTFAWVQNLPSDRPWIIAHGGASGPLPGNTLQAFQRAIAVGANFITCEVVITKDQQVGMLLLSVFPCVLSAGLNCGIIKNGLQSSQRDMHSCTPVQLHHGTAITCFFGGFLSAIGCSADNVMES